MKRPFELVAEIQDKDAEIDALAKLCMLLKQDLAEKDAEIERLKELCARAADALDVTNWKLIQPEGQFITELRKADPMNDDTSFETHRQQILQLGRIIVEQHAEIERLKQYACQCEASVHSAQEGYAELQDEIERLKHLAEDRLDRLKMEIQTTRLLKALCAKAAVALESNQIAASTSGEVFTIIDELRKAAQ